MLLKITIFANFMREKIGHFALAETTDDHRPILLKIKIENWEEKKVETHTYYRFKFVSPKVVFLPLI